MHACKLGCSKDILIEIGLMLNSLPKLKHLELDIG